jgi:septal ring factor EnvC (AmiA/AmiB activator)
MNTNKKILSVIILSAAVLPLAGCMDFMKTAPAPVAAEPVVNPSAAPNKFVSANENEKTAVDSALELAKLCEKYSKEIIELRQTNNDLVNESAALKQKIAALEPELAQTKKELNEANDMLVDMRIELNNWKTDIIGYRDEMRQANKAQLQALLKILSVLGGEMTVPQNSDGQPSEESEMTNTSGEPNV